MNYCKWCEEDVFDDEEEAYYTDEGDILCFQCANLYEENSNRDAWRFAWD